MSKGSKSENNMTLPKIDIEESVTIHPEPLTPASFASFGTVITSPLSPALTTYPDGITIPAHPDHQVQPVPANQQTALKTSPISPLVNNYPTLNTSSSKPSNSLMSIFSSFPRRNTYHTSTSHNDSNTNPQQQQQSLRLKLGILERHPYTTQTFCPFNYSKLSSKGSTHGPSDNDATYMLIIVAPTLLSPSSTPPNPPDLTKIRAFLSPVNTTGPGGNDLPVTAVTYAAGTWHAPMIVLGSRRVDFLVTQFANGVPEDDCQEVLIGSGPDEAVLDDTTRRQRAEVRARQGQMSEVEIDVSFLLSSKGADEVYKELEVRKAMEERWTTDEFISRTIHATRVARNVKL